MLVGSYMKFTDKVGLITNLLWHDIFVTNYAISVYSLRPFQNGGDNVHILTVASKSKSLIYWFNRDKNQLDLLTATGSAETLYPTVVHNRMFIAAAVDRSTMQDSSMNSSFVNTVVKSGVYCLKHFHWDEKSGKTDYLPIMDDLVLEFEPGKDSHTIAVTVLDDSVPENEEFFTVGFNLQSCVKKK